MSIAARMPQNHLSYKQLAFCGLIMLRRNAATAACSGPGILLSQFWHEQLRSHLFVVATTANSNLEQRRLSNVEV
jgi:hypothetical protein